MADGDVAGGDGLAAGGGGVAAGDDLAGVVAAFGAALRDAGLPVGPDRCERFARAVTLVRPRTFQALRECALATLVSSREQASTLLRVFDAALGGAAAGCNGRAQGEPAQAASTPGKPAGLTRDGDVADLRDGRDQDGPGGGSDMLARVARAAREHAAERPGDGGEAGLRVLASAVERLSATDFAELSPAELSELAGVMRWLTLAVPERRSRRQRRGPRGRQADLRGTLRRARRTGGHPFGIVRKTPIRRPRKLVVLCDISGSMEPYARAMLQLLYCAAGGARAEVFSFATRLTRLTPALVQPQPWPALQHAGRAAPDWLGGTRIGSSLKEFNDAYGLRGLARGAVVVVVSDGWDTGDPAVVRREMQRLSRVAFRIVWVNPRAQSPDYQPLAAGMAAAWPYCDAVVSAHRLDALGGLAAALADPVRRRGQAGQIAEPEVRRA